MTDDTTRDLLLPWLTGRAERWHRRRTLPTGDVPREAELAARVAGSHARVSVVLPSLNEAGTIGEICASIRRSLMERAAVVDELLVVDCSSDDDTAAIARDAGATVFDAGELVPAVPPVPGKGDALWRSLSVVSGDIVVWIDSDIRNFSPHFVTRLIAPLIADPAIAFVKGFYRRPIVRGGETVPDEGGRVTELLARPLLAMFFPELSGFVQPLAGEYAGRVDVLRRIPFFTGFSVEVGMLIDLLDAVGLDALAQIDLGERVHRNKPLADLAPMAYGIGRTILARAEARGRTRGPSGVGEAPMLRPSADGIEVHDVVELERPPMDQLERDLSAISGEIAG